MLVHQILKSKATADVVTVKSGTSVSDAAKVLAENRIGTVVISDDGIVAKGILSERDIVREIGTRGASCMNETVDDMMTTNLITCGLSDRAGKVLQMMTDGRFRHMPVLEDGKMVGLITLGDVVKARMSELEVTKDALQGMIMGH
ncbi:CBS domain-containing protein [Nereida sp. MMG025]|uniref:CBS domain-containing protein n=1 Tax=Nereida sp. MMG025 TaxID=2909981 RepID=UPI001F4224C0|nr:CBS domain-containing protein [Nereida sp. MMG025]MCF6443633.1 CBS domain-containing protein [Nereida sp. MMG025]